MHPNARRIVCVCESACYSRLTNGAQGVHLRVLTKTCHFGGLDVCVCFNLSLYHKPWYHLTLRQAEAATALPSGRDYAYHSAFRGFPKQMRAHALAAVAVAEQASLAHLGAHRRDRPILTAAIASAAKSGSTATATAASAALHAAVMDTVDLFLEDVDHLLDEARGERLAAEQQDQLEFGSANRVNDGTAADFTSKVSRGLRPQMHFGATALDNSADTPWCPWYWNDKGKKIVGKAGEHPLRAAIEGVTLPSHQLSAGEAVVYPALGDTPLHFVDSEEALSEMIGTLKGLPEIAVDLEHHNYHSFQGFTCLMQISTRTEDFIVDTLALRAHLPALGAVFHDPATVKVLHGAQEDVRWLQRDFGLYVVNLFDTGIALQALKRPRALSFLIDHFCQLTLDKTFQTADWRVRPLPGPLVAYARQDTHYLLYCYDRLRATLLQAPAGAVGNLLVHVWNESRKLSLTVYDKPTLDAERSWSDGLGKAIAGLTAAQLQAAKALYNWRDATARAEDESQPAVMTNATLVSLSTRLPTSSRDILRIAQPASVHLRKATAKVTEILSQAAVVEGRDAVTAAPGAPATPASTRVATAAVAAGPPRQHRPMTGTLPSVSGTLPAFVAPLEFQSAVRIEKRPRTVTDVFGASIPRARLEVELPAAALPPQPTSGPPPAAMAEDHAPRAAEKAAVPEAVADSDAPAPQEAESAAPAPAVGLPAEVALPPSVAQQYGRLGRRDRLHEQRAKRRNQNEDGA